MPKLRVRFSKAGKSAFISHLDLMRTFSRAFNRAGLRLKHSEGFNPHPAMSIAYPLPLGAISRCEMLDCETLDAPLAVTRRLNAALPDGLEVTEVYEPATKAQAVAAMEYGLVFLYDRQLGARTADALNAFYAAGPIPVVKKTKRGEQTIDLLEHVSDIAFECTRSGELSGRARFRVLEAPLNPNYIAAALADEALKPDFVKIIRMRMLDADGADFK